MGNKQGHELSPEEKQRLKEEKKLLKEDKERKKRLRKIEQKRLKDEKKKGSSASTGGTPATNKKDADAESVGGSSVWSEKSVGSAPESWYHSASEPASKRSSIYLPASAGPGYYQHDCWYSGYEDSGSEKSKPSSRAGSRPGSRPPSRAASVKDTLNLRSSSLERYPFGVPKGEAIEPMHKAGSLDLTNVVAAKFLEDRDKLEADLEAAAAIACRYDETIRASRDKLEKTSVDKASLIDRASLLDRASLTEKISLTSSVYHSAEEGSIRGEKRKVLLDDRASLSSVYYSADEGGADSKRKSLDYASDHTSATGSVYYSADEGGSVAGSLYYSAASGSEVEDHVTDQDILGKDRPSQPSKPVAVDREGSALSRLAYIKVENDALLLHWEAPESDGGTPISGYILERCEGDGDMWVRVNLVLIKDTEYAVANLIGGREYRFRVSAENAVGMSDPSDPSELVSISTDQEATEPHFLKELRDVTAVEGHRVEFVVDIIGTPPPDITWYKDGFEIYDTKRFEFIADGDRYSLVLKEARLTDAGDIRVRATNRVGVASSQAVLHIQAPPHISLPPQYEQGLIFDTDELIRLRVPFSGRPQPLATWAHNGKQIEQDERHTIDVSEKYATLKIAGACRLDKGMYSLNLANPQGIDNVSFFVTVTDRPDPPSLPVVTDISGQSVTLRWDPPQDDGGCRVSNYIVEYFRVGWDVWLKGASSRITWTQLNDLIIGSEYCFRVKAENAYGVSDPGEKCEPILIDVTKSPSGYENATTCMGEVANVCYESTVINQSANSFGFNVSLTNRIIQDPGTPFFISRSPQCVPSSIGFSVNPLLNVKQDTPENLSSSKNFIQPRIEVSNGSFKRSFEEQGVTSWEERVQKIKKLNESLLHDRLRNINSITDISSSPESVSEYSTDTESTPTQIDVLQNYEGRIPMSSGNLNPSYNLGFVSNGCSKVNFLGSLRGIETDDEVSASSTSSPLFESSCFRTNEGVNYSVISNRPTTSSSLSTVIHQNFSQQARNHQQSLSPTADLSWDSRLNQNKSSLMYTSENGLTLLNTVSDFQSALAEASSLNQAFANMCGKFTLNPQTGVIDQSGMNLYFDEISNKLSNPDCIVACEAGHCSNLVDSNSYGSDEVTLHEDTDSDTIICSPSKITEETQPALCESQSTGQVPGTDTAEGVKSIPFDTSGSKSWSTSVVTDSIEHAQKETVSTLVGLGGDTGEGITSIPYDTSENKNVSTLVTSTTDNTQPALCETNNTLKGLYGDTGEGISSIPSDKSRSKSLGSTATPTGEPWMSRVAIAHKFRIICGGLASMKHLGNINALANSDSDSEETETETDVSKPRERSICRMRAFSNDETIDDEIGSLQSEEVTAVESEIYKDDESPYCAVLPYQQVIPTPPYSQTTTSFTEYPIFQNQTFISDKAVYLSPQSVIEDHNQIYSPPSLDDITVFYQPTVTSYNTAGSEDMQLSSQTNNGKITDAAEHSIILNRTSPCNSHSGIPIGNSPVTFESSSSNEASDDKLASWEPKINQAITSRINLLEDLVYKCLENEDAALNEMPAAEEEGAAALLSPVSKVGLSAHMDPKRCELHDLIKDLGNIVRGMNECTRTLSADNVAKFFERTASVVSDHGTKGTASAHSDESVTSIEDIVHSSQSSHSRSSGGHDKTPGSDEVSKSGRESIADVFLPSDQIHIMPSIVRRIDHLDDVMKRCLENEDVTMNTLESGGPLSPSYLLRDTPQQAQQHDAGKVELKDLIGSLGSLVTDLGQKFNPAKK